MECKLCSKKFSNGKALGGHMRSHFATLPLPPKTPQRQELSEPPTESTSSIFSCDERESSGEKSSLLSGLYGLREKPRKSFRLADPDFFDAVVDRESESESTRVRCKRAKEMSVEEDDQEVTTKGFLQRPISEEPLISELVMEEDVALCLIMLSKDVWRSSDELTQLGMSRTVTKVYKCEKCDKIFKSSQGLGSHRANHHHKKIKNLFDGDCEKECGKPEIRVVKEQVVHGCVICGRIFKSAQALGGHKRSHFLAAKLGESLVEGDGGGAATDLNLPTEIETGDENFDSSLC